MKSFVKAGIFVGLIGAGGYYLYSTNHEFKQFVTNLIEKQKSIESVKEIEEESNEQQHTSEVTPKKSIERKIAKTLKSDKFQRLDEYARKTPRQYEKNIQTLAQYLVKPASTDIEKIRTIFTWVAKHIKYDADAFSSGNYQNIDYSAESVLIARKSVCEGYSNLMEALCKAAGIEAVKISGYAKGYGYQAGDKLILLYDVID
ncbi:MAG TPA: transglutaminase domain-containing protein [Bacteroidia bacterium]|jgi:transglutaminase/protease-like cytokinesis protein 3|nr:transglutaminase domain-containing protein [Bacteroidia bacterium]HRG52958.1 transglutaminase domain-containing protein [Bacteroidia bacterium]